MGPLGLLSINQCSSKSLLWTKKWNPWYSVHQRVELLLDVNIKKLVWVSLGNKT